jgi:hypothetical protein
LRKYNGLCGNNLDNRLSSHGLSNNLRYSFCGSLWNNLRLNWKLALDRRPLGWHLHWSGNLRWQSRLGGRRLSNNLRESFRGSLWNNLRLNWRLRLDRRPLGWHKCNRLCGNNLNNRLSRRRW